MIRIDRLFTESGNPACAGMTEKNILSSAVPGSILFAHSAPGMPDGRWHRLDDHLHAVGKIAKDNAEKFEAGALGQAAGLLHDLGKYGSVFQSYLRGDGSSVDHSTAGARIAADHFGSPIGRLIAFDHAVRHGLDRVLCVIFSRGSRGRFPETCCFAGNSTGEATMPRHARILSDPSSLPRL